MEGGGVAPPSIGTVASVYTSNGTVASVYSGCIAMVKCTQLLTVFCKYSRTPRVLRQESWSSISK